MPSSVSSNARHGSGASSAAAVHRRNDTGRTGTMRRQIARRGEVFSNGKERREGRVKKGTEEEIEKERKS